MSDRLARLRERMASEGVDLVALGPGAHLAWLLDLHPHGDERPLVFCVTANGEGFLMPALEADSARQHTDLPFYEWTDAEGPSGALETLLEAVGASAARSIALDECMRADHAALLQDRLLNAKRQFSETTVGALRMRKEEGEYAILKRNAVSADTAMQAAWAGMRAGMTEAEVAEIVRESFREQGARPLFNIVGAGGNGAFPHHQTGNTVLQPGDAVVMDIGGKLKGYSSDITRMAVIGEPPEGYAEVHAIVDAAVEAAMAAARPGVKAHVVDDAARGVIADAGYGEYFLHRTGHGLGTEVHEPPYITASSQSVLDEGMVFSIEPGIYLPGRFGLRLEEIVILRADGPEILSDLPRDWRVI
ncbi:M24 family metallopeptidase [Oricola sp.]|uniref:M24 family metallopeptidase n=1 Tax=Oricola sp. TaxID=1979950 RepID=UPI003BA8E4C0